jgi:hypothetical protein
MASFFLHFLLCREEPQETNTKLKINTKTIFIGTDMQQLN